MRLYRSKGASQVLCLATQASTATASNRTYRPSRMTGNGSRSRSRARFLVFSRTHVGGTESLWASCSDVSRTKGTGLPCCSVAGTSCSSQFFVILSVLSIVFLVQPCKLSVIAAINHMFFATYRRVLALLTVIQPPVCYRATAGHGNVRPGERGNICRF